jgi:hypothetical protein
MSVVLFRTERHSAKYVAHGRPRFFVVRAASFNVFVVHLKVVVFSVIFRFGDRYLAFFFLLGVKAVALAIMDCMRLAYCLAVSFEPFVLVLDSISGLFLEKHSPL